MGLAVPDVHARARRHTLSEGGEDFRVPKPWASASVESSVLGLQLSGHGMDIKGTPG